MNVEGKNTSSSSQEQSRTTLKPFRVMLYENRGHKFKCAFDCYAEDPDDAAEQAEMAFPGCEVISCSWFDDSTKTSNR